MSSNQLIHALYDDDDILLSAVKSVREKKYYMRKFTLHFLFMVWIRPWGLKKPEFLLWYLSMVALDFRFQFLMMNYIMIEDWPQTLGKT